jgi:hypothetical protein
VIWFLSKDGIVRHEAEQAGKKFAEAQNMPGLVLWLKNEAMTHKKQISWAFGVAFTWAAFNGCPPFMNENIPALVHLTCGQINMVLLAAGSFLAGAGYVNSDAFKRHQIAWQQGVGQDKRVPGGSAPPPVVTPPQRNPLDP